MPKITFRFSNEQLKALLESGGVRFSTNGVEALGAILEAEGVMWTVSDVSRIFKEMSADVFIEYVRDNFQDDGSPADAIADVEDAVEYWNGMGLRANEYDGVVVFEPLR